MDPDLNNWIRWLKSLVPDKLTKNVLHFAMNLFIYSTCLFYNLKKAKLRSGLMLFTHEKNDSSPFHSVKHTAYLFNTCIRSALGMGWYLKSRYWLKKVGLVLLWFYCIFQTSAIEKQQNDKLHNKLKKLKKHS